MSDPVLRAFFLGRALAQAVGEQIEATVTNGLSELAKLDAEQRERLRQFSQQVMEKAARDVEGAASSSGSSTTTSPFGSSNGDLQVTIDELRAEIARLRTELQLYRSR
ncbi:DUF6825 family protein [Merismopedia glauca]|uniref:Thylakoid lumen protein n=1 Tax=Merismopedia glauca CCAP 1448/3 TaxID=1296344 RepID=A0A2T1C347_9CYAN|nr:hypothetical protein [Merismopedia glauca]PSB02567.1 hypothetical protein C7B64_12620 [Merismopedia glauca CCAP 1448/3]